MEFCWLKLREIFNYTFIVLKGTENIHDEDAIKQRKNKVNGKQTLSKEYERKNFKIKLNIERKNSSKVRVDYQEIYFERNEWVWKIKLRGNKKIRSQGTDETKSKQQFYKNLIVTKTQDRKGTQNIKDQNHIHYSMGKW